MKKILMLVCVVFLAGCTGTPSPEAASAEGENLSAQITEKEAKITELEHQVQELTDMLGSLQGDYNELKAATSNSEPMTSDFLCEAEFGEMKYQNPASATAIVEGWFALQDQVQELQGTYSTTFWEGVDSRIHTIRYINVETGLSTTTSFMIFFDEADWSEGLLWMTEQCWLDYPHD
jgi:hypothetical protein